MVNKISTVIKVKMIEYKSTEKCKKYAEFFKKKFLI